MKREFVMCVGNLTWGDQPNLNSKNAIRIARNVF